MKMIEGWAWHIYGAWSSWVTAGWAIFIGYLVQYPEQQAAVLALLPDGLQDVAGFVLGLAVYASIKGATVVKQRGRNGDAG